MTRTLFQVPLPLRLACYTALIAGLVSWMLALAEAEADDRSFKEGGLVEWLQILTLVVTASLFLLGAWLHAGWRWGLIVAAGLSLFAVTRELDSFFGAHLPAVGWRGPAAVVAAATLVAVWPRRQRVIDNASDMLRRPAGMLAWMGFVQVVIIAQIVGQGNAWQAIMGDAYSRDFKRTLEELLEMIGYLLLLSASLEAAWFHHKTSGKL